MADQASIGKPLKKRPWSQLVIAKIECENATSRAGSAHDGLSLLARGVRSGDPETIEAQAARRYWPPLFGGDFHRDRMVGGINAMAEPYRHRIAGANGMRDHGGRASSKPRFGPPPARQCLCPGRRLRGTVPSARRSSGHGLWREGIVELTRETKPRLAEILFADMSTA